MVRDRRKSFWAANKRLSSANADESDSDDGPKPRKKRKKNQTNDADSSDSDFILDNPNDRVLARKIPPRINQCGVARAGKIVQRRKTIAAIQQNRAKSQRVAAVPAAPAPSHPPLPIITPPPAVQSQQSQQSQPQQPEQIQLPAVRVILRRLQQCNYIEPLLRMRTAQVNVHRLDARTYATNATEKSTATAKSKWFTSIVSIKPLSIDKHHQKNKHSKQTKVQYIFVQ